MMSSSRSHGTADMEKRLTRLGVLVVIASGAGWLFDGYVINIWSIAIPIISKAFSLTVTTIGVITSFYLIGYMLGTLFGGTLADYFGRRRMLSTTVVFYAVFGALTALAQGAASLSIFRLLTGTGTGMELPVASTYVTEAVPSRLRSRAMAVMNLGYPLGYLLAISSFAAFAILGPAWDWRLAFAVAIIPGLFVWLIRRTVAESPRFEKFREAQARGEIKRSKFTTVELVRDRAIRKDVIGAVIYWIGNAFTFWTFTAFIPLYLVHIRHFSTGRMLFYMALFNIFYAIVPYIAGWITDSFGRRPAAIVFAVLAGVGVWFMTVVSSGFSLLIVGGITYGCVASPWITSFAHSSEAFPTRIRGTAIGTTMGVGRIVSIIAPITFGVVASQIGFSWALRIGAFAWILTIGGYLMSRETRGVALDAGSEPIEANLDVNVAPDL